MLCDAGHFLRLKVYWKSTRHHLGLNSVLISLCHVPGLCHSFKVCALPPFLLFQVLFCFFFFKDLFVSWISVSAWGTFSCGLQILSCTTLHLVPNQGPLHRELSLSGWTTRGGPCFQFCTEIAEWLYWEELRWHRGKGSYGRTCFISGPRNRGCDGERVWGESTRVGGLLLPVWSEHSLIEIRKDPTLEIGGK